MNICLFYFCLIFRTNHWSTFSSASTLHTSSNYSVQTTPYSRSARQQEVVRMLVLGHHSQYVVEPKETPGRGDGIQRVTQTRSQELHRGPAYSLNGSGVLFVTHPVYFLSHIRGLDTS